MFASTSHTHSSEERQEDLLDLDISGAEAMLTNIQNRPIKKLRLKRSSKSPFTPPQKRKADLVKPKITLRPLLVSRDDKGVLSNENARDIFYAIMDSIQAISQKQDRMEDRLRRIDERTTAMERLLQQGTQKVTTPTVDAQCPVVAPTRYCEVCYVAGHQASECRSKLRMEASHVDSVYKMKGICKKCHCIH
nr:unnamed protein product [Haemonchus contortus]